jgi:LEA14-like dessication related protein
MVNVPVQYSGKIPVVKRPSVSMENFVVVSISLSGAELSIELNVENPNSFQLQMNQLSYDLQINGLESISGSVNEQIYLEEGSSKNIKLPLSISFLNAGMSASRILNGNEDLEYKLTGSTTIGSDLPYFKLSDFDFDKSGSVNILR